MTFEIDLNPHSFVVFMTIAAGVSYIFFNSRTGFGAVKLMTILFFVIPMLMIGNSLGHSVDLIVGTIIGYLTAKRPTLFNPFTRIRDYFGLRGAINKLNERLKEREDINAHKKQEQHTQEEAARRQEQAKQERERKRRSSSKQGSSEQKSNSSSSSSSNQNSSSSSNSNQSHYQKPTLDREFVEAMQVLQLSDSATFEEAKKAYRKLSSVYHPDKQGDVPPAMLELAAVKMAQINVAWNLVESKFKNR